MLDLKHCSICLFFFAERIHLEPYGFLWNYIYLVNHFSDLLKYFRIYRLVKKKNDSMDFLSCPCEKSIVNSSTQFIGLKIPIPVAIKKDLIRMITKLVVEFTEVFVEFSQLTKICCLWMTKSNTEEFPFVEAWVQCNAYLFVDFLRKFLEYRNGYWEA